MVNIKILIAKERLNVIEDKMMDFGGAYINRTYLFFAFKKAVGSSSGFILSLFWLS